MKMSLIITVAALVLAACQMQPQRYGPYPGAPNLRQAERACVQLARSRGLPVARVVTSRTLDGGWGREARAEVILRLRNQNRVRDIRCVVDVRGRNAVLALDRWDQYWRRPGRV